MFEGISSYHIYHIYHHIISRSKSTCDSVSGGPRGNSWTAWPLKTQALQSFETSETTLSTTRHQIVGRRGASVRLCMTFELSMAFKIHIVELWIMTPCSLVSGYRRFGVMCCLHILPWRRWRGRNDGRWRCGAFFKLRKATISYVMSVCPSPWNTSAPTDEFSCNLIFAFFGQSVEKIQISLKSDKNNGYFIWRPIYILIISHSVFLKMKNVLYKSCRENLNTHFVFSNFFPKVVSVRR